MTGNDEKPKRIVLDRAWLKGGAAAEAQANDALRALTCNLKKAKPCCGGKGYRIALQGALAHAELCSCVRECSACCGRARLLDGNDSKACRQPSPNVVVNLINAAHIPARYADAEVGSFRNFSGNAREVLAEISRWKSRFRPVQSQGLVIEGPVGVGKTYLLAALAKEFAEQGWSVRFSDFFQLLGELKAGFSEGKADAQQLQPLIDVDVLFIDELGKGRNNDFELTVLDQLVCGRYNQNKTIIASTNYRLKASPGAHLYNYELDSKPGSSGDFAGERFTNLEQRIGPRIYSRLKEMTQFVELTGVDYRRREAT